MPKKTRQPTNSKQERRGRDKSNTLRSNSKPPIGREDTWRPKLGDAVPHVQRPQPTLNDEERALIEEFRARYPFTLDPFQEEAIHYLAAGESAMVAAPIGTGKTISGRFLDYWLNNGGLPQQGFAISDVIQEKSDLDGKTYQVQYFERAVFELRPENAPPYDVLLSQLGTFRYKDKYPTGK